MINTTNTNAATPSLMGQSAQSVRVETKSSMLTRLENTTEQKKNKPQAAIKMAMWWPMLLLAILVVIATTASYFTLESNTSNERINADLASKGNQSKQVDALANQENILANRPALEPQAEPVTATILTESATTTSSFPDKQNTHDTSSTELRAESRPVVVNKKQTEIESTAQVSPSAKPQVGASAVKATTSNKLGINKQDPDVKVIDALVTPQPENTNDHDVKVLAALVLADKMAKLGPAHHAGLEKNLSKPPVRPIKLNATQTTPSQSPPMVLGNAGETVADKLAQCSSLSFVEAPICRIRLCFGNVGTVPECTPEFKRPELNTDEISPIKGH